MSECNFDELSVDEQRNEILKAIHNRLSEISICLEYVVRTKYDTVLLDRFQCEWTKWIPLANNMYEDNQEGEE